MLTETKRRQLADKIAAAIKKEVAKRGTFLNGGCILVKYPGRGPTVTYAYCVRDGKGFVIIDEDTGLRYDYSIIAAMKIDNAEQAREKAGILMSGVLPTVAKYATGDGFANYLGGFLAIISDEDDEEIIGVAVSGDTEQEDLACASSAIGVIRRFLDGRVRTPACTDILDAILACNIAKTCDGQGCRTPLIIGDRHVMEKKGGSTFSMTLRARGVAPVSTSNKSLRSTVEAVYSFINRPPHRKAVWLVKICSLAANSNLRNQKQQPKDCIVVVGCEDLASVLAPFFRGNKTPILHVGR